MIYIYIYIYIRFWCRGNAVSSGQQHENVYGKQSQNTQNHIRKAKSKAKHEII